MASAYRRYVALALLAGAQVVLLLAEAPGRRAAASDETTLARCALIYDAASCRCALDAIASAGSELEMSRQPQVAAIHATTATPSAAATRVPAFSVRDVAHVLQACMAPGRDTPAD
jgi:hypothetical protein